MSPPVLQDRPVLLQPFGEADPHPVVQAFLEDQLGTGDRLSTEIHPADSMYRYALHEHFGLRDFAVVNYLRAGCGVHRLMEQVLRWRFGADAQPRVLDFASGYGRTTRFFVLERPAWTLTVSDIDEEAVRFQRERFGVHGFVSAPRAEELHRTDRFDAVFAASFLSHMPQGTFEGWLGALWELVSDGGVLAFSVNDEAVLPTGARMPQEGFYFERLSESDSLDLEEYGSTWVTEEFVQAALERATGAEPRYWRIPRALWHRQDLYVVSRGAVSADLPDLDLARDPDGRLENCQIELGPTLALDGWAAGPAEETLEPVSVEVYLGGRLLGSTAPDSPRDDVSRHLGDPPNIGVARGWWLRAKVASVELHPATLLMIKVRTSRGAEAVLHLATLGATTAYLELATTNAELLRTRARALDVEAECAALRHHIAALRHHIDALRRRLEAMEASRFWKLRNRWFAVKRFLRLTDEA